MSRRRRWLLAAAAAVLLLGAILGLRQWLDQPSAGASDRLSDLGLVLEDSGDGLYVLAVRGRSPARHAGFSPGDRLLAMNDLPLDGSEALEQLLALRSPREPLAFRVSRDGETLLLTFSFRRNGP